MWRLLLSLAFSLNCYCKQPWLPRERRGEKLRFSQDAPLPAHRAEITVHSQPNLDCSILNSEELQKFSWSLSPLELR